MNIRPSAVAGKVRTATSKWLERSLLVGPHMCLCLTEADFHSKLKHLRIDRAEWPAFIKTEQADATTHLFTSDGKTCAIVTLRARKGTGIQTAAMLCHEAVHIWQDFRRSIGETSPGDETEAYAIQAITQWLMESYVDQTKRRR